LRRQSGVTHRLPPRGLANPWRLPALHSLIGKKEKGTGGAHAEMKQSGGGALAKIARVFCTEAQIIPKFPSHLRSVPYSPTGESLAQFPRGDFRLAEMGDSWIDAFARRPAGFIDARPGHCSP
jgi:hypothetical protein